MTLQEAQGIIAQFQNGNFNKFDSHDFINNYSNNNHASYTAMLASYNGNKRITHLVIANFLRRNANILGISPLPNKKLTFSVNANLTPNKVWNNN